MATPKVSTMNFYAAFKSMFNGKTITRLEWANPKIYCLMKDAIAQIHTLDGFHSWIISEGDILGEDWVVLENVPDIVMN